MTKFFTVALAAPLLLVALVSNAPGEQAAQPVPAKSNEVNSASVAPNNLIIPAGYVSMQTRLFVPNKPPYDKENWAETTMGQIIGPLVAKFPELKWYWFSRYVQPLEGGENGDTDITKIPSEFFIEVPQTKAQIHRSLRFRFCLPASKLAEFEQAGEKLIKAQGCAISDWRDWDLTADLGGDRAIGEILTPQRRAERAEITARLYHASSQLAVHCLIGPDADGYFRFERNTNQQATLGSSFATPHHIFCNITEIPLCVLVRTDDKQLYIGTFYQPPTGGTKNLGQVRVRY